VRSIPVRSALPFCLVSTDHFWLLLAAKDYNMSFFGYVANGPDTMGVAVLLEDGAAILGVVIATLCTACTYFTGNLTYDAIGSIVIGGLLGATAVFLIRKNTLSLLGQTMPSHKRDQILRLLQEDIMVKNVTNVKAVRIVCCHWARV